MDILETGMAFLATQNRAAMSVSGSYLRPATSITLTGIPFKRGSSNDQFVLGDGSLANVHATDLLINTADIGVMVWPVEGDIISIGSTNYEVQPYGNEPCARWADEYHKEIRIHTKEVVA